MPTRTLESSPRILPLYARAAAPLIPGASLLPFVPGGGGEVPDLELEQAGVRTDPAALAAYAKVCGFVLRDQLPPTYPHVLSFPLHMAVMADGAFPFGAVGLVHIENRIAQRAPLGIEEELTLRVRATKLVAHPKGQTFSLVTEVRTGSGTLAGSEPAWEEVSTFLRRGRTAENAVAPGMRDEPRSQVEEGTGDLPASAEWRLGGDLGRRYAAVSGDRNPIHMHSLTAKPLGFPAAIAHGMWTKARCLAALEPRLPGAFEVEVSFRKPILLPAKVEFASATEGKQANFAVRDARRKTPHLDGRVGPLANAPEPSERSEQR